MIIRPWAPGDGEAVRAMILDCLRVNAEVGADMLPTDKNAGILWNLGIKWASEGEPTLVYVMDNAPIAYTLWGGLPNPIGIDYRDRICSGLGTYVLPSYRKRGVSVALRAEAERQAKARGYNRVCGVAYHEAGLVSALRAGFIAVGSQVELRL